MTNPVAHHGVTVRAARTIAFADRVTALLMTAWRRFMRTLGPAYRPEQHYMRGPGPKWQARNQKTFGAINGDLRRRNDNQPAGVPR